MVAGIFHEGSGLGDQLFRYITVRTLAEKKGYEGGMIGAMRFKGASFLKLDMGKTFLASDVTASKQIEKQIDYSNKWEEKKTTENGTDIRSYDPEINFVEDNTIIDGSFEDDKYWRHNLKNIDKWLKVEPLVVPDNLCVIGFRGGEYANVPELFLGKDYWDAAIAKMREINSDMRFQVHTDDPTLAKTFFPDFEIVPNEPISHSKHTNMGFNWRSARYAKYAIIPNSAFFILPRILRHQDIGLSEYMALLNAREIIVQHELTKAVTIAPRYWARRNTQTWARPACYYPEFTYL